MAEKDDAATAAEPNKSDKAKSGAKAKKASRTIKSRKSVTPSRKASAATKKKAAKDASTHPHTNRPRQGEMGVVGSGETPSGVGLEGFRSNYAPRAGSEETRPTAKGGPPEASAKRRRKVTGHV